MPPGGGVPSPSYKPQRLRVANSGAQRLSTGGLEGVERGSKRGLAGVWHGLKGVSITPQNRLTD